MTDGWMFIMVVLALAAGASTVGWITYAAVMTERLYDKNGEIQRMLKVIEQMKLPSSTSIRREE